MDPVAPATAVDARLLTLSAALLQQQRQGEQLQDERDRLLAELATARSAQPVEGGYASDFDGAPRADAALLAAALAQMHVRAYWRQWRQQWAARLLGRLAVALHLDALPGLHGWARAVREHDAVRALEAGSHFDGGWYLLKNPDVVAAGLSPALHYLRAGAGEGRAPGPTATGSPAHG